MNQSQFSQGQGQFSQNQSQINMSQNRSEVINKKEIEKDLDQLFQQLKIESQGQQSDDNDKIDKSTLLALLLYLNMDSSEQEFFNYVKRSLEKANTTTLTKAEFKQLFLEPDITFKNLKNDEMTSIFKIFDRSKKGSFSAEDFIYFYKNTQEYMDMSAEDQSQIEARIKKDFEIINPDAKEITPIEFFKIINNANQQQQA